MVYWLIKLTEEADSPLYRLKVKINPPDLVEDEVSGRKLKGTLDTMHLSHHQLHRNHHYNSGRAASLRLSPTRVSLLASHYAAAATTATVHTYQAQDFSDISIRGEFLLILLSVCICISLAIPHGMAGIKHVSVLRILCFQSP